MNRSVYGVIFLVGLALATAIQWKYRHDLAVDLEHHHRESHDQLLEVADRLESTFRGVYQGLRTIARLPGVRAIPTDSSDLRFHGGGQAFDGDAKRTVQEIYNNMATNAALSEVYIVPVDLEPDPHDPASSSPREPWVTFDELIVGHHKDQDTPQAEAAQIEVEEIEIYEYRLMKKQLAWMKQNCPRLEDIQGMAFPVIGGPEVVTCDNTRFSPIHPDDQDRSGLILSVPFFAPDGTLKGCISGVILSHAIRDLLPSQFYAIRHISYDYTVLSSQLRPDQDTKRLIELGRPDPNRLYSEAITLETGDMGGDWRLWVALPDVLYWQRRDVQGAYLYAVTATASATGLMLALILAAWLIRKNQQALRMHNLNLENRVKERTQELTQSERKVRQALKELENQKLALDTHAIVAITDPIGRITYANDQFCQISQYPREELIGQDHRIINSGYHPKSFFEGMWDTIQRGEVWKGEIKNVAKDGTSYWVDSTILPLKDDAGVTQSYIAIRTDITRRKLAEQKAEAAREQAEAADRSKSEFLANMSHEIRTPMTAILGYADLLQDPDHTAADHHNYVEIIRRNGDHLVSIINDILDLSKIEAGKMTVERIACSAHQILADVDSLMRVRANNKGLTLGVELLGPTPHTILSDPIRLRQILVNLVGNAIKFTESGGVRITVQIGQANASADPSLQFQIIDTGIGMSQEQMNKLFKPFSQADSSVTRHYGGTGLGLVISKRFAEMLGGDIRVASTPNEGTCFTVTIATGPLEGVAMVEQSDDAMVFDSGSQMEPTKTVTIDRPLNQVQILLAEDGPDNQRLISFLLKKWGASVTLAENGRIAADLATQAWRQHKPFDVILMDMQMPEMDGYTATTKLRDAGYTAAVIALTAHAMAGDRRKCLDAGCDAYATKPIDKTKLLSTIQKFLRHTPSESMA